MAQSELVQPSSTNEKTPERRLFQFGFWAALTLEQFKVLLAETFKGLVSWSKDCVGALLLQQVSQTGRLHQREENPAFIKCRKRRQPAKFSDCSTIYVKIWIKKEICSSEKEWDGKGRIGPDQWKDFGCKAEWPVQKRGTKQEQLLQIWQLLVICQDCEVCRIVCMRLALLVWSHWVTHLPPHTIMQQKPPHWRQLSVDVQRNCVVGLWKESSDSMVTVIFRGWFQVVCNLNLATVCPQLCLTSSHVILHRFVAGNRSKKAVKYLTWTVRWQPGTDTLFCQPVWWWTSWGAGHSCCPLCCRATCRHSLCTQPGREEQKWESLVTIEVVSEGSSNSCS